MSTVATLSQFSADLTALVQRAAPVVVGVRSGAGAATGTVIGQRRVVVAAHALHPDAGDLEVWANDSVHPAESLGRDPSTDLAFLQVTGIDLALLAAAPTPSVGSLLVSVGRAWNNLVASLGVVHAHVGPVSRRRGTPIERVLRTTITPFPGFSGGPVLDAEGRLVGIATAGLIRGAGLALPLDVVQRVGEEVAAHGRIRHGFLGVTTMPVELGAAQQSSGARAGLLVTSVVAQGPAATAGIYVGDIIVAFDGKAVADPDALVVLLTGDRIGQAVPVSVVRASQVIEISIMVGERNPGTRRREP